jgi:drug/metabolite transporter (DMT)-like permease
VTPSERTGAASAAAAITAVGASIAVSGLLTGYPVLAGQALRYLGGALVLGAVALLARRPPRPTAAELGRLAGVAATGLVAFNVCLIEALRRADPGAVGVVVGTTPLVLAVLGPLLDRARPAPRLLLAGAVVVAGVALVEGGGASDPLGLLFATGTMLGEVCFSLLAAPLLPRLGALGVSLWTTLLAGAGLAAVAAVTSGFPPLSGPEALAVAYLAVVVTAVAFLAWYGGVARLGVARAGLFTGLFPVAAVLAEAALGGGLALRALAGALVVAGGVVLGARGGAAAPADALPVT